MRRVFVLLPLVCVGCPGFGGQCDEDALIRLSETLQASEPREQVAAVWPGVEAACGDALSDAAKITYGTASADEADQHAQARVRRPGKAFERQTLAACPNWPEVASAVANVAAPERGSVAFEGCDFGRYGVVTAEEAKGTSPAMVTFGLHQWFLDQGLTPEQARPISRALYALERRGNWLATPALGQVLPDAKGAPLVQGQAVYITGHELAYGDRKVATLDAGALAPADVENHIIAALFDSLADGADIEKQMAESRGEQWVGRIVLVADENTPMSTIRDVMYTAGRAEYRHYSVLVQAENSFDLGQIPIDPPMFSVAPSTPSRTPTATTGDRDEQRNRFARYMHQPDEVTDEPPPEKFELEDEDEPEPELEKDPDSESKMGKPTSKRKSGLYAMKGPKDAIPQMARNFDPDMIRRREPDDTSILTIEMTAGGYSVARGPNHQAPRIEGKTGDYGQVETQARALAAEDPKAHRVVISAENDVPLKEVVAAIVAARGAACEQAGPDGPSGPECILPDVTLAASGAHTQGAGTGSPFVTAFAVGNPYDDDEDVWGGLTGTDVGEAYGAGAAVGGSTRSGYGRGEGAGFGGKGRRVPRVRQAKHTVKGSLDSDIIRRIVRAHINEVRSCYNAGLTKDQALRGRVTIEFVIGSTGKVQSAEVKKTSLADKSVGDCIAKATKRWKFPRPKGGGNVTVSYPYTLAPG